MINCRNALIQLGGDFPARLLLQMWGYFCSRKFVTPTKQNWRNSSFIQGSKKKAKSVFFLHLLLGEKPFAFVLTQKYPHKCAKKKSENKNKAQKITNWKRQQKAKEGRMWILISFFNLWFFWRDMMSCFGRCETTKLLSLFWWWDLFWKTALLTCFKFLFLQSLVLAKTGLILSTLILIFEWHLFWVFLHFCFILPRARKQLSAIFESVWAGTKKSTKKHLKSHCGEKQKKTVLQVTFWSRNQKQSQFWESNRTLFLWLSVFEQ